MKQGNTRASMRRLSLSIEMSLARFFVFLVTLRPCFHSHSYGQILPDAGWGPKSSSGAAICPTGFSPKPISAVARGRIRLCYSKFVALCSSCFCSLLFWFVLLRKVLFSFCVLFFFKTSQDFPSFRFCRRTADKLLPSSTTGAAKPPVFAQPPRSPASWHSCLRK